MSLNPEWTTTDELNLYRARIKDLEIDLQALKITASTATCNSHARGETMRKLRDFLISVKMGRHTKEQLRDEAEYLLNNECAEDPYTMEAEHGR